MISRRGFLRFVGAGVAAALFTAIYTVLVEPFLLRRVKRERLQLSNWPANLPLKIAVLTDIHACEPWMPPERIARLVATTNALDADIVLLLGDYCSSMRLATGKVLPDQWAKALGKLKAPLGVFAILGNHDWWSDEQAQRTGEGPIEAGLALQAAGITVLENDAIKLTKDGQQFWLAGLGDQLAFKPNSDYGRRNWKGVDDLGVTLAQLTDDDPALLMAHEPDIFPKVPERIALTLSGHTHGGQVRLFGWSPLVPSKFKNRYAYGHIKEEGRDLLVSGGLGFSILPVRLGMPPEINLIDIGSAN